MVRGKTRWIEGQRSLPREYVSRRQGRQLNGILFYIYCTSGSLMGKVVRLMDKDGLSE